MTTTIQSDASTAPDRSAELFDRALAVTPGGVNSPVRAFRAVGGTPRFMARGVGAYLYDVDGREYVDLVCSWGPMILGHAHPEVVSAVQRAVASGTSFGTPVLPELELAEEIVARTPVDQVRLVSSGTEATMSAIRLARGFTGRELLIKFAGCYHGHVDSLLASAGSGVATLAAASPGSGPLTGVANAASAARPAAARPGMANAASAARPAAARPGVAGVLSVPGTPGVPAASTAATLVLPYNDLDSVRQTFSAYGDQIACVITEAACGNMGAVAPVEGFNAGLAELCRSHGALFISDEVMTGFRVSRVGHWGLDGAREGWTPDLMTFGKVMGGGFPAAAFGGREDVMAHLAPLGPVYQAGTLSGNPIATTAGLTTLRLATDEVYCRLDAAATTIAGLVRQALYDAGVPHVVQAAGNLFSPFFVKNAESTSVRNFTQAGDQALHRHRAFFHSMLDQGVYLPPSAFEAWFVSAAHDDRAIDRIAAALPRAAAAAAASRPDYEGPA